ncbi:MAG: hypothetical protein ACK4GT_19350, partial [Pararhodobacter sp.]
MTEALLSLIPGGGVAALFAGLGAALLAVIIAFFRGRSAGQTSERAKQDAARHQARDTADRIDRVPAALTEPCQPPVEIPDRDLSTPE